MNDQTHETHQTPNVTYRWIKGVDCSDADWDRVEGILASRGWMALNRPTSCILLAEDAAGELAGFSVFQLVPHVEPLWTRPSMRGTGLADALASQMIDFAVGIQARGWIAIADNPVAAKLCEDHGMTKVESPVYVAK